MVDLWLKQRKVALQAEMWSDANSWLIDIQAAGGVPEISDWLIAIGAGLVFAVIANQKKWLTASGAVAGGVLATSIIALGGWAWALPGLSFFVLSSLLSRVDGHRVRRLEAVSEKGSRRDAAQVVANGGVAWVCLLGHALAPHPLWLWGYVGAFCAAAADTWATEVGTLLGGTPRLITTGKHVSTGTSGAVSMAGLLAAIAGALSVWGAGALVFESLSSIAAAVICTGAGFLGALVDTLLGATLQARYRDAHTGVTTERAHGESRPHSHVGGLRGFNNDRVNLVCTVAGAGVAVALAALLR